MMLSYRALNLDGCAHPPPFLYL